MPLEHKRAHQALINFIHDWQADEVINIGDINDYTAPARWSAGKRAEYGMNVHQEADYTRRNHFEPVRAGYDGPYTLLGSNHGERPQKYLAERAPALYTPEEYREDRLLRLDDYGVSYKPLTYEFAPGWVATHGHARGISLARHAGGTALNAARKLGRSVVMGHTHRAGIIHETSGISASHTLTGVEIGHLMDVRKATYLGPARLANWQRSFAIAYVQGKHVTPHIIPVRSDGSFIVEGDRYK
ncbi:hypothetical protein [Streptomyces thioluteus]